MSNKLYISPYTEIRMIEMWGQILNTSTETKTGGDQDRGRAPKRSDASPSYLI